MGKGTLRRTRSFCSVRLPVPRRLRAVWRSCAAIVH
jgi:hypothetical protein